MTHIMDGRLRRALLAPILMLLAACGSDEPAGTERAAGTEEKVLHVYNWVDYIGETTIADFEARTGIKVTYDVYDSNEILETKLLTGGSGYDVVVPAGPLLERNLSANVFLKLDKSKLPNLATMDPDIMRRAANHDPGNQHGFTYLWGTTGLGYNPAMIEKALGTRTIDSWAAVFDPAVAAKLADCGIAMLDAPHDVLSLARIYLGLDMNSETPEDLAAAEAVLMKVRPFVRYFDSSRHVNDLASGEICIAIGWSGGMLQARARGATAATPVEVAYAIPKEGAPIWFDMIAIPIDAPHPENAHAFLDYLMDPEVAAGITNLVQQPTGSAAALPFVDERIASDPAVYPTDEVMQRLQTYSAPSAEFSRQENRAWTRIRSGQ